MTLKSVVGGSLAAAIMTPVYVLLEIQRIAELARASGLHSSVDLTTLSHYDFSALFVDPTYLSFAVGSFAVGFYMVLHSE